MSNKLKFSETPIYVSSIEDFQKACEIYQSKQSFISKCESCGKEIHFLKNNPYNRLTKLLCPTCNRLDTIIQKYGSWENYEKHRLEKAKETSIKKYGVDNIFKRTDIISAAVEKKYGQGITCGGLIKEAHVKQQQVMLEKYGHPTAPMQTKEARKKSKINCSTEESIQKRKRTCIQKYGCEASSQSEEVKQKATETCLRKWGRLYGGTGHQKCYYFYENIYFDSSWELAYYIYLKDHHIEFTYHTEYLDYFVNGKKHKYEVDFKVEDTLVEIKGDHLIDENGNLIAPFDGISDDQILAKSKCMKDHNVKILKGEDMKEILNYVKNTYGKDFLGKWKHR